MNENAPKSPASMLAAPAPITLIMLVTLLLVGVPMANKPSVPSSSTSASKDVKAADASSTVPQSAVLQMLRDYRGAPSLQAHSPTTSNSPVGYYIDELKQLKETSDGTGLQRLRCMIALVPDPLDSHFPLTFDNAISSIHQAFRDHGYVRDRQSLLWQYPSKPEVAGSPNASAPWREQPGAILFRKTVHARQSTVNELVLVLLVGETPTAGVHRSAFFRAMDFVVANQLCLSDDATEVVIPILGPTFSGTSASVQLCMQKWWSPEYIKLLATTHKKDLRLADVQIISGSATLAVNQKHLSGTIACSSDGTPSEEHLLKSTFKATVLPDIATQELLLRHLVQQNAIKPERIALLTEDTAYGSPTLLSEKLGAERVRIIPFPLALSRMRSEYQKSEKAASAGGDSVATKINVQRRNVTLESESTNKAIDAMPTFSSVTPATVDLAMSRILEVIKQEEIQAVGIVATDVQDVLFLAKQVRMVSPDVLLFTTESEVLYTHTDLVSYMRGMLIASTYPLSIRVEGWFGKSASAPKADLSFPSASSQGIYNATLGHLNAWVSPGETMRPFHGYQMPLSHAAGSPPLWLSVVTDTGIWPVDVRSMSPLSSTSSEIVSSYMLPAPEIKGADARFSLVSVSRVPSVCFAILGAAIIVVIMLRSGVRPRTGRMNRWMAQNLLAVSEVAAPQLINLQFNRQVAITVTLLGIAMVQCLLLSPLMSYWTSWIWLKDSVPYSVSNYLSIWHAVADLCIFVFCLTVLIASLCVTARIIYRLSQHLRETPHNLRIYLKYCVLVALALALLLVIAVSLRPLLASPLELVLFLDRSGELTSGVSPIMPLVAILAGILIWSVGHWFRSYMVEECRLVSPVASERMDACQTPIAESVALPKEPKTAKRAGAKREAISDESVPSNLPANAEALSVLELTTLDLGRKLKELRQSAEVIRSFKLHKKDILFTALVVLNASFLFAHWVRTFEGWLYDCVLMVFTWIALAMFLILYLYTKSVCQALLALLRTIAQHPILPAFERAPQRFRDSVSDQLVCRLPDANDLNQRIRYFLKACRGLSGTAATQAKDLVAEYEEIARESTDSVQMAASALEHTDQFAANKQRWQRVCRFRRELSAFTSQHIVPSLNVYWLAKENAASVSSAAKEQTKSDSAADPSTATTGKESKANSARQVDADAELFLAIELMNIFRCAFVFVRNSIIALIGILLCLMVALQSYPFVIRTTIQSSLTWIACWVVGSLVLLMVRFNRDEVLSRIGNSTPNRFQFDGSFFKPMLTYVALPVLGILAIQFPSLTRFLFGWLGGLGQFISM